MGFNDFASFREEIESSFSNVVKSQDAFLAIDYKLSIFYLNAVAERYFKKKKAQLIGRALTVSLPKEWPVAVYNVVQTNVVEKRPFEIKYYSALANQWINLSGSPFENYFRFTFRSIDHKQAVKAELRNHIR